MKKKGLIFMLFALLAFGPTAWAQPIVSVNYIDASGQTQTANATSLDTIALVNPNGTTIGSQGFTNWYVVQGSNVVMNGQLGYYGGINLILCDGAKLTVKNTNGSAIQSLDNTETTYTLTIYVQTQGTGQLVATSTSSNAISTENLTIHGGTIIDTGGTNGIYTSNGNIVINGGTVTSLAPNGNAIQGYNVTINGGIVSATGNGGIKNGMRGQTILGYTNSSDRITATNYQLGYTAARVDIKDGQYMITDNGVIVYGWLNENKRNAIAGHTLSPYTPTEWSGSGNSATDPYIISSVDDLNLLSLRTNGSDNDYSGKYFKLGANITYTPSTTWNDATSTEHNFTAISGFNGHFDGDGYTISGLRIYASDNEEVQNGLFTNLGPNAYVENLTISNARITGEKQIGAIAGYVNSGATVTNCHVTGTVTVHAWGHTLQNHGGVVGYNAGIVSNCVSEATVSRGNYAYGSENVGGIAGYNSGTLSGNKVFNANITAGSHYGAIVGLNDNGTLTNNYYHACTVNGTANATGVGVNGADVTTNDGARPVFTVSVPDGVTATATATINYNTVNYYKEGVTVTLSGGLTGTPTAGWQKAYYVNGEALQENSTTISHDFDMPAADANITIGEIHADWAISNAGTQADPYTIYFTDQLDLLATRVNNGTSTYSGSYFKLMDDLTYDNTEQNNYTAIGTSSNPFSGHFDGNHKTVEGIRIYGNSGYQGVFGYINNAEVNNLDVNDIVITAHDHVGCIVGECNGSTITNCRVTTATLNATDVYPNCSYFGGIAGRNLGTSTMSNNFVLGVNIPYVYQLGAIAGFNQGLVSNYYHDCSVDGTASPTGIGCNTGDVITNDGARPVFTVSVPVGVSATATATVTHNTVNYYKEGVTVTLSGGLDGTPGEGLQYAYIVYGNTLTGSNLAPGHEFDMQNANAVVTIGSMPADWAVANEGTQADPYKIYFTDQLDLLATRVNAGNNYSGKFFKLMDDLTYSYTGAANENNYTAIGTSTNPFSGHFDGDHKTINGVRINSTGGYQGVFGYINNAEVKNLFVDDIVIAGHDRVGSIVGECDGSSTITGCRVTTATLSVAGDASYQQLFGGIAGRKSGSTMSNNFVIGITIPQVYHTGAIAGENGSSSQSLVSNYYHNCTVGSTARPTGVGCNLLDVEGAKPVFTLTLADGISSDASPVVNYNTVNYYENGITVNLSYSTPADPGYEHIYSVNGTRIEGDSFVLSANSEVTVNPNLLIDWETEYAGTEADPYLIYNDVQWDFLASNVSISGFSYSGKFFKLMEDISVTSKVGDFSNTRPFSGAFDGNGHTLTYTYNVDPAIEDYVSPFSYINGATIKNLHVTGLIKKQGGKYNGGIAGRAEGTNHIIGCRSSVDLQANTDNNFDISTGGLLGEIRNGIVYFENCLFDGKMRGYNNTSSPAVKWGGFVGWVAHESSEHAYFTNCLFAPTQINLASTNESYTFARRNTDNDLTFTNCYYLTTLGTTQGKQPRTINAGTNVEMEAHGVSQVGSNNFVTYKIESNYNPCIFYNSTLYSGNSENVKLNLRYTQSVPEHHVPVFTATGGTLSGSANPFTLAMPNNNVTINYSTHTLAWEGSGTEVDPYQIHTTDQWSMLGTNVDGGTNYSGKFFKLMADISVTTMVGASTSTSSFKSFNGTFDGNGHTLNVTYNGSGDCTAPFTCISGATIKDLHVTGTIATTGMRPASIASFVANNSTIANCWSEVSISSSDSSDIDAGAIVARVNENKSVTLNGCMFTGSITYSNSSGYEGGGMVGWTQTGAYATLNNCYFAPSSVSLAKDSGLKMYMFVGGKRDHVTLTNCYYNDIASAQSKLTPEGKRAYNITGGEYITVENTGSPTEYNVSGITSYGTSIKCNDMLYAGDGDNVSLNLGVSGGYVASGNYSASAGTLTGTSNPYSLTMPNENVTITALLGFPIEVSAGRWYAISSPMHNSGDDETVVGVTHLTDASYDLFGYDETAATWRNQRSGNGASGFNTLIRGHGYIYRRSTTETLIFTGEPNSSNITFTLTHDCTSDASLAGFNLVGNPYPQEISSTRAFYRLRADGTWQAYPNGGTIAAGEAVLFHTDNPSGETLTITPSGITPAAKGALPPLPKGLQLDGEDEADGTPAQQQQFAYVVGDGIIVTGSGLLEAYDIMGRRLFTQEVDSQLSILNSQFPTAGVYVLRMGGKAQKIVIK